MEFIPNVRYNPTHRYCIPQAYHEMVDKQIKDWFNTGAIEEASDRSIICNNLTTVSKRDSNGRIYKDRRRDPRPLNKIIKDDTFKIPL